MITDSFQQSPGGLFMVQKMTITSPFPQSFKGYKLYKNADKEIHQWLVSEWVFHCHYL